VGGTVEAVGDGVTTRLLGERVATADAIGTYAEYCIAPADLVTSVPKDIASDVAAAAILKGITTHFLINSVNSVLAHRHRRRRHVAACRPAVRGGELDQAGPRGVAATADLTIFTIVITWRRGRQIVTRARAKEEGPLREFVAELADHRPRLTRVPGTAVFLNPGAETAHLAKRANVEHNHVLHRCGHRVDGHQAGAARTRAGADRRPNHNRRGFLLPVFLSKIELTKEALRNWIRQAEADHCERDDRPAVFRLMLDSGFG
jgi:hypothetical protein